ncbi:MAG: 50S ribosomal protein L29 [Flavobacteriaceae bacterium]
MKQSEIQLLSPADLQDKLTEVQKQLSDLQLTHAISPLENPLQIRGLRRTVARLKTALKQKQD